ncbi:MAG: hypothetical protein J0I24_04045 [Thiomonas arsenitoxydans]|uniref:Uncharacterized protein n=1 Tax=Thiomonas arsenitoxydans (strain DSM 22701 / CIP 110005 / 3As) TaxID=426114 RepID=A0A8I1MUM7_THIA3|nr:MULTISPECIES: hypothetical protein [Thiomonas]MBN8743459.1 hypothetical protein [Thiomonas arsenitoxydans]ODU96945.1 MAG: hypothetical protein ABT24_07445 [Thiomonas sp. SCN 64-16]
MTYYCVAASAPGSAASIPCSPDNIGLTQADAGQLAAALLTVAAFAFVVRVVLRFLTNSRS